jgi:hypothetical protein
MICTKLALASTAILLLPCVAPLAAAADDHAAPYDVVWTSPSIDAAGSMPLGNGEVGINLWANDDGTVNFYLSRSDSFSEIGRLLKVGQLRVTISPNPFATAGSFRQHLVLHDGVCQITAGGVNLKVFVDADQPVVHVTGASASRLTVTATAVSWRTADRPLPKAEARSAWTLQHAPFPLVESADVFPPVPAGTVAWYHRNDRSAVPSTIEVQSLQPIADTIRDPLLHRTFGGWITADGFQATADHALTTPSPVTAFDVRVAAPCVQSADVTDWTHAATAATQASSDAAAALARTTAWWHAYWDRSWVATSAGTDFAVPANTHPLRVGFDSNHQNGFPGPLERATTYDHPLTADEIARLAATGHDQPTPINGTPATDFTHGFTLSAWIHPDRLAPGRIFDKVTAGVADGFLFDTHPGHSLRLVAGPVTLVAPPHLLTAGQWHHAAATVDPTMGTCRIYLDGKVVAEHAPDGVSPIGRGYALQRYVQACEGRGAFPIKFNGGIFTVEPKAMGQPFNADYRAWGECFWWQNTRHMYHPMLAGGDLEMMDPLFAMYQSVRPACEARAKLYHHADGCYFPETMTPWGTYANGDYGWDRAGHQPQDVLCPYWQYAWNQGPELVGLMLDRWDYAHDPAFAQQQLLPMAGSVLRYFDTRFKRDGAGHIVLNPTQAIETFWSGVTNDMPSVAGLRDITARLCDLPPDLTTPEQRTFFTRMRAACPNIPIETKTIDGQQTRLLAPAATYKNRRSNVENPELMAVWPFRLYGLGKPDLALATAAYAHRVNHLDVGWGWDGNCAALLGLTDESARILVAKCGNSRRGYRWPATWGPNFDWLPDQNHGGNLLETTQLMLLQCDGTKIRLLPAWPKRWDVSFKLHATGNTTVECDYRAGRIAKLVVTPPDRAKDVVLPPA